MIDFSLDACYTLEKLETMEKYWGVNTLNALLEHLLRQTLSYFSYFPLCAEYKHLQHTDTAVAH